MCPSDDSGSSRPTAPHSEAEPSVVGQEAHVSAESSVDAASEVEEPLPWDLGIFDAHCHVTERMGRLAAGGLGRMRTRALITMASRREDQSLVENLASEHPVVDRGSLLSLASADTAAVASADSGGGRPTTKVVPAFGWHPWFSHRLYDDRQAENGNGNATVDASSHYTSILHPTPDPHNKPADAAFLAALPPPYPLSRFLSETRERLRRHPLALVGEIGLDKRFQLPLAYRWDGQVQEQAAGQDNGDDDGSEGARTPGGRGTRRLSPYHVSMKHQLLILRAHLALAAEEGRAVSVHGVQAHGTLYECFRALWRDTVWEREARGVGRRLRRQDRGIPPPVGEDDDDDDEYMADPDGDGNGDGIMEDDDMEMAGSDDADSDVRIITQRSVPQPATRPPFPPRICLHSFSGSPEVVKQWLSRGTPAEVYFSFSAGVNLHSIVSMRNPEESSKKLDDVLRAVRDDRILVESDHHLAGPGIDDALDEMYRRVCAVKGWSLREGVEKVRANFERFVFGGGQQRR